MKKRTLLAVLGATVILTLGLTACGSKQETSAQPETVIETETEEIIAEVTEEPETEEVVAETTEQPVETETEEAAAEETEAPENETTEITVTEMSATKYAKSSVNVRKGPGTEYDKVGSLGTNQQVAVTGQAENGWFRIDMNGTEAFVSNKYLSDNKVTVNTANGNAANKDAANQTPAENAGAQQDAGQAQTPPTNNNAGAQQPSQPQTPPAQNNNMGSQPSQPQTPPADNNTGSVMTKEEMEEYYGTSMDNGEIYGGGTADPEWTQDALDRLPDDAFNVQVGENGGITADIPPIRN